MRPPARWPDDGARNREEIAIPARIRTPRRACASAVAVLTAAAVLSGLQSPAAGGELGPPALGYWTDTHAVVADDSGNELRRFSGFDRFSFTGALLAGEREGKRHSSERVVGFDVTTGDRLFTIRNAMTPVVAPNGGKVFFLPTYRREEYTRSVWMRGAGGRVRKVAQFKAPGVRGIPHGMGGDGAPLDLAVDGRGRYVAVAFGLETLRSFDVWIVDTKTRAATRMTRGENSHNASVSPDGEQLVVRVERPKGCPDPVYGDILIGKIRVIARSTGEGRDLTEFGCDLFYDTPRWIDDETLLAVRVTKDAGETYGYDLDIVRIDAASGAISDLVTEGNPCCITVSPGLGKVAYGYSDRRGLGVLDVGSGTILDLDEDVYVPHLSGEGRM